MPISPKHILILISVTSLWAACGTKEQPNTTQDTVTQAPDTATRIPDNITPDSTLAKYDILPLSKQPV